MCTARSALTPFLLTILAFTLHPHLDIALAQTLPANPEAGGFTFGAASTTNALDIPSDGSLWLQHTPGPLAQYLQDAYLDNGDGIISAGDAVVLNGVQYEVNDVGVSYYADTGYNPTTPEAIHLGLTILVPLGDYDPGDPSSSLWREIPLYEDVSGAPAGELRTIGLNWLDADMSGAVNVGDSLYRCGTAGCVTGWNFRILSSGISVSVDGFEAVSASATTWGRMKLQYR